MSVRIAHVVRQFHPSVGGMEEVVRHVVRHQRDAGHRPFVVTLDRLFRDAARVLPARDEVEGVPVVRLPFSGSTRYPLCPRVLRALDGAELIHVHGVDFFFDYLAATRWLHRRPLVASTHGGFFHTAFARRLKTVYFHAVTRASARAYDRIIATSDNDGRVFGELARDGRLEVIENGVDVRKFHDRAAATRQPTLIYFGRWSENKGLPQALDLVGRLRARDSNWRLIVAGREYDFDAAALRTLVAHKGLANAVELAPNPSDSTLAELIGHASYFVCLSRHEGFGLAALEAMSAGLIPVLSDIPPFRALVERSGLGVLVGEDHAATVAWLERDRHDDAVRDAGCRKRAIEFAKTYDWERVAGRYLRVYEQLEGRA